MRRDGMNGIRFLPSAQKRVTKMPTKTAIIAANPTAFLSLKEKTRPRTHNGNITMFSSKLKTNIVFLMG